MNTEPQPKPTRGPRRNRPVFHEAPLAAAEADTAILAEVSIEGLPVRVEVIAARAHGEAGLYEVCCTPFFVRDLAFGDLVRAHDGHLGGISGLVLEGVESPSGHVCLRVWFPRDTEPTDRLAVETDIGTHGGRIERLTEHLLSVDVPEERAPALVGCLARWEDSGRIEYETGHSSQ